MTPDVKTLAAEIQAHRTGLEPSADATPNAAPLVNIEALEKPSPPEIDNDTADGPPAALASKPHRADKPIRVMAPRLDHPYNTCRWSALWAEGNGLRPIPIRPREKAPIGNDWGTRVFTPRDLNYFFDRFPGANVGLLLGAEGGVIDIDVDQPEHAQPVLDRIFPAGLPETLGWSNGGGRIHLLFWYDPRFAQYKHILKGVVNPDGEITGNPHYAGVEVRLGARAGEAKQFQTVIPPSRFKDGRERVWNPHGQILPAPESLFADLEL